MTLRDLTNSNLGKPPWGRAWDHYIVAPRSPWVEHRGPYTASRIDLDDWEYIEHVRAKGRLPGAGALQAWGVQDYREPLTWADDVVDIYSRRAERKALRADRTRAAYLTRTQDELDAIEARNLAAIKAQHAKNQALALKRLADEKAAAEELARENRAWRGEMKRWKGKAKEREERWKAEQWLWDEYEGRAQIIARRRTAKAARRQFKRDRKLAQEAEAEVARKSEHAKKAAYARHHNPPKPKPPAEPIRPYEDWQSRPYREWLARKTDPDVITAERRRVILERVKVAAEQRCAAVGLDPERTREILLRVLHTANATLNGIPPDLWHTLHWTQW